MQQQQKGVLASWPENASGEWFLWRDTKRGRRDLWLGAAAKSYGGCSAGSGGVAEEGPGVMVAMFAELGF